MIKKVLIANRGEIAVRLIRACQDLGLNTVAVYSDVDDEALHVHIADEAVCIGGARSSDSYLNIPAILSACEITHADAIHPGYGFLSENSTFAAICESSGVAFIGPCAKAIELLGNKAAAKAIAKQNNCPVIEGSEGVVNDAKEALRIANSIGYPVFIKASAGGGGKGIRIVHSEQEFEKAFYMAKSEAKANFGNDALYIEKMIKNPRHIEVQILGDMVGNYIHLGERNCSLQRRRQKLVEEAPSPFLAEELRHKMCKAAIAILKATKYHSAATVEFLVDDKNFYFMEVNTRIQVEHTITEELYNFDIVQEQLKIAMQKPLSVQQSALKATGHVIECRINAEDPADNWKPSPGVIHEYIVPGGPHVRVDGACYSGYNILPFYDSMIAKLIVKGDNRSEALRVLQRALREFYITGIKSTIDFYKMLCNDENFLRGRYDINYIDKNYEMVAIKSQ